MKHTVEEVSLRNGSKGLLIDVPGATTMSMQFHFRAGSRYVKSQNIEQVAHIMEHMAFGANAKYRKEQEFEFEFTKNGAYHNAYTSDLSMAYQADCADFEWDRILGLQRVAICQPRFNEIELQAEKGNVKSELTNYLNDHYRILWPRVQQVLGEDVLTYRQSIPTIANVTLGDVKEHHKRTHTTANMRFVIAGELKGRKSEIIRQIGDFELPRGEALDVPLDNLHKGTPTVVRRKDATNMTFGMFMIINRKLSQEELNSMHQLNHILTGTTHSRIFGKARSKGLAYNVSSYTGNSQYYGSWDIIGHVNHESSSELFDIIHRELGAVLAGKITEEELGAAQSFALGRYQMGAQTVSQISGYYTDHYFDDGYIRDYHKVPDAIKKVSMDSIISVASDFFRDDTWVLAAVSSRDRQELVDLNSKLEPLFEKIV
jgi:predicted Zn-dependent peptidase